MKKIDIERQFKDRGAADMPEIDIQSISARAVIGNSSKKGRGKRLAAVMTATVLTLAVLASTAGVVFGYDETEIYIDVNPSVVLAVTPAGTVKEFKCLNEDAEAIFNPDDFEGKTVDAAAEMVFAVMDSAGYLEENDVTISSAGKNEKKNARLMEKVKQHAENRIKAKGGNGKVYSGETSEKGKGASVSPAKQRLIDQILAYPQNSYCEEELSDMGMKELKAILKELQ